MPVFAVNFAAFGCDMDSLSGSCLWEGRESDRPAMNHRNYGGANYGSKGSRLY